MRSRCDARRCVAPPANHEKKRATSCAEMAASSLTSCNPAQRNRTDPTILFSRMLKQLLGDSEIHKRRVDVSVSHVCGQIRKVRLGIDALPIPRQHAMNDKGMA